MGIFDQENVTFKCTRHSSHFSNMPSLIRDDSEKFLPTIRGNTDAITVRCALDYLERRCNLLMYCNCCVT